MKFIVFCVLLLVGTSQGDFQEYLVAVGCKNTISTVNDRFLFLKESILLTPPTQPNALTVRALDAFGEWYRSATPSRLTQKNPDLNVKCKCAGDPVLPNPNCNFCYCPNDGKLPATAPNATFPIVAPKACLNLKKAKKTVITPVYSPRSEKRCTCEKIYLAPDASFQMCQCPTTIKIPTSETYTAFNPKNITSLGIQQWPVCKGAFALCSMAKCKVPFRKQSTSDIGQELAECGCILAGPDNSLTKYSQIDPTYILDKKLKQETLRKCGLNKGSTSTCTTPNSSPVCRAMSKNTMYKGQYNLISTYSLSPKLGGFLQNCKSPGTFANCMTAACYATPAFDGSPVTCYCPLYKADTYTIGNFYGDRASCTPPEGTYYSGGAGTMSSNLG